MKPGFWLSAIVVSLGAFIVALPDSGPRIIDISERHGPSLIDTVGLVLVLIPWTWMIFYSLIKWRWVLFRLGRPFAALSLTVEFVGLVATAISVSRDGPYWWMEKHVLLHSRTGSAWRLSGRRLRGRSGGNKRDSLRFVKMLFHRGPQRIHRVTQRLFTSYTATIHGS